MRSPRDDARDLVALAVVGEPQVGGEIAERDWRRTPMVAAAFVGVRRAELALHFPDQVRQLAARRHALEQRLVAAIDGLPVDARHVLAPRTGRAAGATLRAASAAIRAAARPTAGCGQVDPAALARRRVRLRAPASRSVLRACGAREIARSRLPSRTMTVV